MALERVFECPRTLRRLRSDPIGKLLEGFCNWLLEHGFSRWTIRKQSAMAQTGCSEMVEQPQKRG